jgi:hypothetical protein
MASAWNYSSFMPSATTQKISKDQYATGARQSVAGPFRSRNLRLAQYLCGAQQLCSSSSKRPHQAQKPGSQSSIRLMLLAFYEPSTRHATCFSIYVNEDCGFAALMQALAAASRKLNCFAALLD